MDSFPLIFIWFFTFSASLCSSLNSDGLSLLALKAAITTDPTQLLNNWSEFDSTPCHWPGIICTENRVTSISLADKGFSGYIPSEIGAVGFLRRLNLSHNNFSKPIPSRLFNATSLIYLDLSHNSLSGLIPEQITALKALMHLDLSSNLLNGSLPEGLSQLKYLAGTLNLSYNNFSGEVPPSYGHFPVIVSLDLRHNNLTGKIPQIGSLLNQGPTAFAGNPNLCGFPLRIQCPEAEDPRNFVNPENPKIPQNVNPGFPNNGGSSRARGGATAVPIISGLLVIIGGLFVSVWLYRKKWGSGEGKMEKHEMDKAEMEVEGQDGKFVLVDEGFNLELEDLLRASAYVLGKSRSGILYKVVVARRGSGVTPVVVAVRRLSEGDATWRLKDFESEVEAIGRVQHPNIVRLRAYYFANDEKLVVSDFIQNGSLYTALHGGPPSAAPPLSWESRLKIAQGTARGLLHIHDCSPRKYIHGNIKTSKILLDNNFHPYISGFGLTRLLPSASKSSNPILRKQNSNQNFLPSSPSSLFFVAPEARVSGSRLTQKCDVYSFGVVLLEILTGRLPDSGPNDDDKGLESFVRKVFQEERPLSEVIDPDLMHEVNAKKQVIAVFHIALGCTELDPELRPRMRTVSESLDRVKLQ